MSLCADCDERPIEMPRVGVCRRCYTRRWVKKHPGYMTEAMRRYRSDPEKAERDRERSQRWKDENRERNRARDRAYARRRRAQDAA